MAYEIDATDCRKSVQDLEKEVHILKEISRGHTDTLAQHGGKIEALGKDMGTLSTAIELIKTSSRYTEENTRDIKATLKKLEEQNHKDHYATPLENSRRLMWQVITLVVAFAVGLLINDLFPFVK